MEPKHKIVYVNEVVKILEMLCLRDSDMYMLFILDRHKIKVNCCENAISVFIWSIIFQCDILCMEMFR